MMDTLEQAHIDGRYHDYLALEIERMTALHKAGQAIDPKYRGDVILRTIEMLKAADLALWQCKEALGYPIPAEVDKRYPRQLAGNCGTNPFQCGKCGAREKYPDLHLKADAERHGGMYVAPKEFIKS